MGGGVENTQIKCIGFTLAELLAVIAILGVIALIAFPAVNKIIKSSKEKAYESQKEIILSSAKNWGIDHINDLSEEYDTYLSIEDLRLGGYLEKKQVINPITEEEMNGCVVISYSADYSQYKYRYEEASCNEVNDVPIIVLNGDKVVSVQQGEEYQELGAIAKYKDQDISSSIVITGSVDTSVVGSYTIRYNVSYDGKQAKEVTRTVKVVGSGVVEPVEDITITLSPDHTEGYVKEITVDVTTTGDVNRLTYKINGGEEKEVINNQIVLDQDGEYVIEVKATDNKGETTTITSGTYYILNSKPTFTLEVAEGTFNESGWANKDFNVSINTTSTNIKEYQYCYGNDCTPTTTVEDITASIPVTTESDSNYVCVVLKDIVDSMSDKVCVGPYKLDKMEPNLTIPEDVSITQDQVASYDLMDGVEATDELSGIKSTTKSGEIGTLVKSYQITYTSIDQAGNSISKTRNIIVTKSDLPIISLTPLNTNGGYTKAQNVVLTVNDNSGLKSVTYQIMKDGVEQAEQTVSINGTHAETTIPLNTNGTYTIKVIAIDQYDNETLLTSGEYKIDIDKPTVALNVQGSPFNSDGWAKSNFNIEVTTSDTGGSNVKSYKYCKGTSNNCTPSTSVSSTTGTIAITTESSTNYVCAVSIDNAGNESDKACVGPYKLDKTITVPTITASTSANSNGWYKSNISMNITTSSDLSTIKQIKYCTTTSTTCTPSTTVNGTSTTATISTESSTNYICALSIDKAGNTSTTKCAGPYKLDKTAPTLTIPANVTISLSQVSGYNLLTGASATDGLSGVDGSITTSGSLSVTEKTYTITYTVKDKSGNSISESRSVVVKDCTKVTKTVMGKSVTDCMLTNDPESNLRFVGYSPNNYVKFNNELWRIIGVFNGQAKIIRNVPYSTGIAWDTNNKNDWSTSTLMAELNSTFLNSIDTTSKSYIDTSHTWNIGGASTGNSTRSQNYNSERGTIVYKGMPTTWRGAIGLMYASDYEYATSSINSICDTEAVFNWYYNEYGSGNYTAYIECANNSWLLTNYGQWPITPQSNNDYTALYIWNDGRVYFSNTSFDKSSASPVLYLKSSVKITGGSGTANNPFTLGT